MNNVPNSLLKPHPKNRDYYNDLPDEKYMEIRQSIETHGIRDPLKVLPDYTVVAGHQRLKIARELGIEKVPIMILDVSSAEAEYLLIADNEERRQSDDDPIRKAKRAKFLAEYWDVKHGGNRQARCKNYQLKTLDDVAAAVNEDKENLKKILKLNDLIAPLQNLVSAGKLRQIAAYSLAFLPTDEQNSLLAALGESGLCGLSVKDAQGLRSEMNSIRAAKDDLLSQLASLENEKTSLVGQLSDLRANPPAPSAPDLQHTEVLSQLQHQLQERQAEADALCAKLTDLMQNPTEKIIYRPDPAMEAELEATRKQAAVLLGEKEALDTRFRAIAEDVSVKDTRLRLTESKQAEAERHLDHARRELERLKSLPRPRLDQKRVNCHALMEKATTSAFGLVEALDALEKKYREDLLAVARVRGGHESEEIATAIIDAGLFRVFNTALEAAIVRIDNIADVVDSANQG